MTEVQRFVCTISIQDYWFYSLIMSSFEGRASSPVSLAHAQLSRLSPHSEPGGP